MPSKVLSAYCPVSTSVFREWPMALTSDLIIGIGGIEGKPTERRVDGSKRATNRRACFHRRFGTRTARHEPALDRPGRARTLRSAPDCRHQGRLENRMSRLAGHVVAPRGSRCSPSAELREGFMELIVATIPMHCPFALGELRSRGLEYAWHKMLRRCLSDWPAWKRRWLYADPRKYWTLRGGDDYFREQEGQASSKPRAEWIADRLAAYRPGLDPGSRLRLWQTVTENSRPASMSRWWALISARPNWSGLAVSWRRWRSRLDLEPRRAVAVRRSVRSTWS